MAKAPAAAPAAKKTCFVISPIGEEGSADRKRSDQLLKHIIKHVLEAAPFAFEVTRADEIQKPGRITQQVIELAIHADLAVADLTGYNPNVLYELAIRHYARMPVIHMIKVGERIPFDIADQRTIYYDIEIGAAEEARVKLAQQVQAVLDDPTAVDNPVSVATQLLAFKESPNSVEQGIARVLEEVSGIRVLLTPYTSTAETQKARVTRAISEALLGSAPGGGLYIPVPRAEAVLSTAPPTVEVTCANCGQPIAGPVQAVRSADSKPIHPLGQCPQPYITPKAKSSS